MTNIIPTICITGIIIFVSLYFFIVLIYLNLKTYDWFFIPFLIGIFTIILIFISNISKIAKLKKNEIINIKRLKKVETCPEYWVNYNQINSTTIKPNNMCSSKDIYDNVSIATVKKNEEGTSDEWNSLDYKNINLTAINKQATNDKICERMFREYNNYDITTDISAEYNTNNKKNITWVEYHNKCLKNI